MNSSVTFTDVKLSEFSAGGMQKVLFSGLSGKLELSPSGITALYCEQQDLLSAVGKVISGIVKTDAGTVSVSIGGSPSIRAAYIPAELSSVSWLNVQDNLKMLLDGKADVMQSVKKVCEQVGLDGYELHYPDRHATGFQFRLALAKCLLGSHPLVVIDNLLSGGASALHAEMAELLQNLHLSTKKEFLVLTGSKDSAMLFSGTLYRLSKDTDGFVHLFKL